MWHQVLGNQLKPGDGSDRQRGSYLGPAFDANDIVTWAEAREYPFERLDERAPERAAQLIANGCVVGWFDGRMEFGPRALGSRSIIGDARSSTMQSVMNLKIKYRESFRPFAPSCLVEDVSEYFELNEPSPYMLLVAAVKENRRRSVDEEEQGLFGIAKLNLARSDVPAITHVDYSARVQTVDPETHPNYYALINAFKQLTGYGIIINTSFNVRGEPIVCTPEEAYLCFMRTEMDALMMEGILFLKSAQRPLEEDVDWQEIYGLD